MSWYVLTYHLRDAENFKVTNSVTLSDSLPPTELASLEDFTRYAMAGAEMPNSFLPSLVGLDRLGAGEHELVSLDHVTETTVTGACRPITNLLQAFKEAHERSWLPEGYFRAVATVEVVSRVPLKDMPLDGLHGAVKRGTAVASITWSTRTKIDAQQVRALLPLLGKSPDFFEKERKPVDA